MTKIKKSTEGKKINATLGGHPIELTLEQVAKVKKLQRILKIDFIKKNDSFYQWVDFICHSNEQINVIYLKVLEDAKRRKDRQKRG